MLVYTPKICIPAVTSAAAAIPTSALLAGFRLHLAPGAARPVLPGAVERVGTDAGSDLIDPAGGKEFDLPHGHGLHLQLGAKLEIDRDENRMAHRTADHGGAVAAHQRRRPRAGEMGGGGGPIHVADQQRG